MSKKKSKYTVSDGKLMLTFEPQEEGGYLVTSPLDPELITQADSIQDGFENARDAAALLREVRRDTAKRPRPTALVK